MNQECDNDLTSALILCAECVCTLDRFRLSQCIYSKQTEIDSFLSSLEALPNIFYLILTKMENLIHDKQFMSLSDEEHLDISQFIIDYSQRYISICYALLFHRDPRIVAGSLSSIRIFIDQCKQKIENFDQFKELESTKFRLKTVICNEQIIHFYQSAIFLSNSRWTSVVCESLKLLGSIAFRYSSELIRVSPTQKVDISSFFRSSFSCCNDITKPIRKVHNTSKIFSERNRHKNSSTNSFLIRMIDDCFLHLGSFCSNANEEIQLLALELMTQLQGVNDCLLAQTLSKDGCFSEYAMTVIKSHMRQKRKDCCSGDITFDFLRYFEQLYINGAEEEEDLSTMIHLDRVSKQLSSEKENLKLQKTDHSSSPSSGSNKPSTSVSSSQKPAANSVYNSIMLHILGMDDSNGTSLENVVCVPLFFNFTVFSNRTSAGCLLRSLEDEHRSVRLAAYETIMKHSRNNPFFACIALPHLFDADKEKTEAAKNRFSENLQELSLIACSYVLKSRSISADFNANHPTCSLQPQISMSCFTPPQLQTLFVKVKQSDEAQAIRLLHFAAHLVLPSSLVTLSFLKGLHSLLFVEGSSLRHYASQLMPHIYYAFHNIAKHHPFPLIVQYAKARLLRRWVDEEAELKKLEGNSSMKTFPTNNSGREGSMKLLCENALSTDAGWADYWGKERPKEDKFIIVQPLPGDIEWKAGISVLCGARKGIQKMLREQSALVNRWRSHFRYAHDSAANRNSTDESKERSYDRDDVAPVKRKFKKHSSSEIQYPSHYYVEKKKIDVYKRCISFFESLPQFMLDEMVVTETEIAIINNEEMLFDSSSIDSLMLESDFTDDAKHSTKSDDVLLMEKVKMMSDKSQDVTNKEQGALAAAPKSFDFLVNAISEKNYLCKRNRRALLNTSTALRTMFANFKNKDNFLNVPLPLIASYYLPAVVANVPLEQMEKWNVVLFTLFAKAITLRPSLTGFATFAEHSIFTERDFVLDSCDNLIKQLSPFMQNDEQQKEKAKLSFKSSNNRPFFKLCHSFCIIIKLLADLFSTDPNSFADSKTFDQSDSTEQTPFFQPDLYGFQRDWIIHQTKHLSTLSTNLLLSFGYFEDSSCEHCKIKLSEKNENSYQMIWSSVLLYVHALSCAFTNIFQCHPSADMPWVKLENDLMIADSISCNSSEVEPILLPNDVKKLPLSHQVTSAALELHAIASQLNPEQHFVSVYEEVSSSCLNAITRTSAAVSDILDKFASSKNYQKERFNEFVKKLSLTSLKLSLFPTSSLFDRSGYPVGVKPSCPLEFTLFIFLQQTHSFSRHLSRKPAKTQKYPLNVQPFLFSKPLVNCAFERFMPQLQKTLFQQRQQFFPLLNNTFIKFLIQFERKSKEIQTYDVKLPMQWNALSGYISSNKSLSDNSVIVLFVPIRLSPLLFSNEPSCHSGASITISIQKQLVSRSHYIFNSQFLTEKSGAMMLSYANINPHRMLKNATAVRSLATLEKREFAQTRWKKHREFSIGQFAFHPAEQQKVVASFPRSDAKERSFIDFPSHINFVIVPKN
ncbi:uncharacterized protein MONOS_2689 [Monocercomonoides exilis]|uniref:uncharacterized protein n=1 Tax=Monocercomonoides exilis TaxID=2049356 RepID=UPI00355A2FD6|nr:hypothetical protein MONOS_2689 [Monocercomonoides exilis]|eukprot:MONOS_2689.1-p1 / transcript=MONOS_2689.1 / gene=MONOS_2689 / organism=Monocercomonoides_exilis_PA203 / gene_product=unspecified product / transcript_product=unspecified product / location=Mono_scaffold00056:140437-145047(+) / protein_length=1537 / sequence_SO=supercontig / SO=protein_coding / is_pseudo=false